MLWLNALSLWLMRRDEGTREKARKRVGSRMVVLDLLHSIYGVRCSHGKRVTKCKICMMKVNGRLWDRVLTITDDHEVTEAVMQAVVVELLLMEEADQRKGVGNHRIWKKLRRF